MIRSLLFIHVFLPWLAHGLGVVLDLNLENFNKLVLQSEELVLVEFYNPWRRESWEFVPVYKELARVFGSASKMIYIARVDHFCISSIQTSIKGSMALRLYTKTGEEPKEYDGSRDVASLVEWVTNNTGVKPGPVEILTDDTFDSYVNGDKDVLVWFFAPWSEHCKALAPTWETVARDFAAEPNVVVAKIDDVNEGSMKPGRYLHTMGHPTIVFFPKGSKDPEQYIGDRHPQAFIDFLNEKTGNNRQMGGGLNAKAGLVDVLDKIITKLTSKNVGEVAAEVKNAAESVGDRYAGYYVEVLEKLMIERSYVKEELERLELIPQDGQLQRSEQDDLTCRVNILRQFRSAEQVKDEL